MRHALELGREFGGGRVGGAKVRDAVSQADAILLTTPGMAEEQRLRKLAESLGEGVRGKVLCDVTNPFDDNLETRVWSQGGKSAAEVLQECLPGRWRLGRVVLHSTCMLVGSLARSAFW
jgi:predicted dinucleotide-binding enzyme